MLSASSVVNPHLPRVGSCRLLHVSPFFTFRPKIAFATKLATTFAANLNLQCRPILISSIDSSLQRMIHLKAFYNEIKGLAKVVGYSVLAIIFTLIMIPGGRYSALAISGGVMGGDCGHSSSSSAGCSSSDKTYYSYGDYHAGRPRIDEYSVGRPRIDHEYNVVHPRIDEYNVIGDRPTMQCDFHYFIVAILAGFFICNGLSTSTTTTTTRILKLQIGALIDQGILQKNLDQIAETVDTSTRDGLYLMLKGTTHSLLQNIDDCTACYSDVVVGDKEYFNDLSVEERKKFDVETLVNTDGLKIRNMENPKTDELRRRRSFMVVTILAAVTFPESGLTTINSKEELKQVLLRLDNISKNDIQRVQVLWTRQDQNDTMSEQSLHEKYPLLRPF